MQTQWLARVVRTPREAFRAAAIVVLVALVVGGLTSPAQQYLPDALRSLANAAGPWFVVVFIAVRMGHSPIFLGSILGILGFVLLNASYGAVSELRGYPYSIINIWTLVAVPAGVLVGIATSWLAANRTVLVALGAAVPAVVLVAEGIYGLTVILATTGPVVWILEIVGAASWISWLRFRRMKRNESGLKHLPRPREGA